MHMDYSFKEENSVVSPQLVFYPEIILSNIRKMKEIAGDASRLWPHIKTHKSADVTKMLLQEGIDQFKCATIAEMEMAATAGAKRLVLAYPLVGPNVARFLALTNAFPQTECFAISDDTQEVRKIGQAFAKEGMVCPLLMDVDLGQHRTGVPLAKVEEMYPLWHEMEGIQLRGMHLYDGHRHEKDLEERMAAAKAVDDEVLAIQKALESKGLTTDIMIYGGTPSFPCHKALTDGYLSPGTCVIQDAGYEDSFPDLPFVPGAAVLTRVVSHPEEGVFTLDLGTKAVATDPPLPRVRLVGYEDSEVLMQNEEHLVVRVPEGKEVPAIETVVYAIPIHICPTSALYPEALTVEKGHLTGAFPITARNRKITI